MSNSSPFRSDVLAGKRILVTGGGTGLGRVITEGLMAHGAAVHICGRRGGVLAETVEELTAKYGRSIEAHTVNIRDADAVESMIGAIWERGPLTGLINNAAANFISPTKDLSPRGYEAVRSTVMDGAFYCTLNCGKRWIVDGLKGSVVSNLVTWVWTGSAYVVPSAMAKTAVHAMTMSLAVEWGPYGIRLNAVAPGPFPTEGAWEKLNPLEDTAVGATQSDQIPLRRYGQMHELVNIMVFLQSDGCDFLTGQTIGIDGGHHLAAPSTFAGLSALTEEQWKRAREAIRASAEQEKAARSV
jgi:NAD(P)-dependent dehydrogenase (short-subunit alcohol dehydrogenase family)